MAKLACAAAFVPAWYDYGPFHKTVVGFGIHMAEGGGTVGYLDNSGSPPARGVSVHFVIEYSGRIVQMLDITHACGGLNPADRSTNKGYYGHDTLVAVLGDNWTDPNAVSIQIEMEGFAAKGPNADQVAAVIKLVAELRAKIPTLRGAFGHADQTDTKPCPGTTAAMRGLFASIGGHGLWTGETMSIYFSEPVTGSFVIPANTSISWLRPSDDGTGWQRISATAKQATDSDPYPIDRIARRESGTTLPSVLVRVGPGNYNSGRWVDTARVNETVAPISTEPDPAALKAAYNSGVDAAATAAATARQP